MTSLRKTLSFSALFFLSILLFGHNPVTKKKVVIDVGHGGSDAGQTAENMVEKDVVLAIALEIVRLNTREDLEVLLIRTDDTELSLKERAERVNALNPDLALSLHANGHADETENGVEAYLFPESEYYETAWPIAEKLVTAVCGQRLNNRGVKAARFYVLQNFTCPTMLLEVGFLTNADDRAYLSSDEGREAIARQILAAL